MSDWLKHATESRVVAILLAMVMTYMGGEVISIGGTQEKAVNAVSVDIVAITHTLGVYKAQIEDLQREVDRLRDKHDVEYSTTEGDPEELPLPDDIEVGEDEVDTYQSKRGLK